MLPDLARLLALREWQGLTLAIEYAMMNPAGKSSAEMRKGNEMRNEKELIEDKAKESDALLCPHCDEYRLLGASIDAFDAHEAFADVKRGLWSCGTCYRGIGFL